MEKHDVFEFTAPNGAEVIAVCLSHLSSRELQGLGFPVECVYLCYAQNRLFTYFVDYIQEPCAVGVDEYGDDIIDYQMCITNSYYGEVIVDYAILPDYDEMLKNYSPEQNV